MKGKTVAELLFWAVLQAWFKSTWREASLRMNTKLFWLNTSALMGMGCLQGPTTGYKDSLNELARVKMKIVLYGLQTYQNTPMGNWSNVSDRQSVTLNDQISNFPLICHPFVVLLPFGWANTHISKAIPGWSTDHIVPTNPKTKAYISK